MKTSLNLMFLLVLLNVGCQKDEPELIITDYNFLKALIDQGVDTNEDGIISFEEASKTDSLNISMKNIANITGIEAFENLIYLRCDRNNIQSVNLSKNIELKHLSIGVNPITKMDLSNNKKLEILGIGYTNLSSIDLSSAEPQFKHTKNPAFSMILGASQQGSFPFSSKKSLFSKLDGISTS